MATETKIPDFADIMQLENLAWTARPLDYAKRFHALATEYGETVLIECVEQYYSGPHW